MLVMEDMQKMERPISFDPNVKLQMFEMPECLGAAKNAQAHSFAWCVFEQFVVQQQRKWWIVQHVC